jgi:hypothetical protein
MKRKGQNGIDKCRIFGLLQICAKLHKQNEIKDLNLKTIGQILRFRDLCAEIIIFYRNRLKFNAS